jgi:hypothetical protein
VLGRRPDPDPRDHNYPLRAVLTLLEPERRRAPWRRYRTLYQGFTGTCVGHAWRGMIEAAPMMRKPDYPPDAFTIYKGCLAHDPWPDNDHELGLPDSGLQFGTSVRAGAKYLKERGIIGSYHWADGAETVGDFVTRRDGSPVVMGTNWYATMGDPDPKTGVVKLGGYVAGGHAWMVRWYYRSKGLFLCTNSWGAAWGLNGEFLIAGEDLERLILEDGEACCGLEAATLPRAA